MAMNERVARLRQQSLEVVPSISAERAKLMTEFYRQNEGRMMSAAARRALAFQYLIEHKTVCINEGELIVGEKGPAPKATPTYPELCCHTLQDLDILDSREKIPFAVANIFFELNNTDGDLGIHALIDGEAWKELEIEDPRGREMLDIRVKGRLRRQGLTEIFFESAEPTFDDLSPRRFFRRFREGVYEIEGETLDGVELESTAELTHVMPAPPEPTVNGEPMAVQCDEEEPGYDATEVEKSESVRD